MIPSINIQFHLTNLEILIEVVAEILEPVVNLLQFYKNTVLCLKITGAILKFQHVQPF